MMDGLVATSSSIPGHILALGQEASGRLPNLAVLVGCDIELYPWSHFGTGTRSVWSSSKFGCFSIILDWINVCRLAVPDERWSEFEMKRWHQFFVEHIMTPLMTSLPRLPYGRWTQV